MAYYSAFMDKHFTARITSLNKHLCCCILPLILSACSTLFEVEDGAPDNKNLDYDAIPNATPRYESRSKQGNPDSYQVFGKQYYVMKSNLGYEATGTASWYGTKFHGRKTSNGETYDMLAMTAAHKTLPLPSYLEVTNLENKRRVVVRVNDRGPFHDERLIDLSYAAARKLHITNNGTATVHIRAIQPDVPQSLSRASDQTYYLQIAAFRDLRNAEKTRFSIRPHTNTAISISEKRISDELYYRVRVGPFNDSSSAQSEVEKFNALGYKNAFIVNAQSP